MISYWYAKKKFPPPLPKSLREEREKKKEKKRKKTRDARGILLANNCGAGWDLENSICGGTFPERGAGE